jgi:hypothetical protein
MVVSLASEKRFKSENLKCVHFNCRLSGKEGLIKVEVPFRALGDQLQEQMLRADLQFQYRPGWEDYDRPVDQCAYLNRNNANDTRRFVRGPAALAEAFVILLLVRSLLVLGARSAGIRFPPRLSGHE